ncbi:hypothetical protein D3C81_1981260 [compost metagenome]
MAGGALNEHDDRLLPEPDRFDGENRKTLAAGKLQQRFFLRCRLGIDARYRSETSG